MKNTHTTEKTIFLIYNKKIKNQTKNKKSKTKQKIKNQKPNKKKNDFPRGLVMSQGIHAVAVGFEAGRCSSCVR